MLSFLGEQINLNIVYTTAIDQNSLNYKLSQILSLETFKRILVNRLDQINKLTVFLLKFLRRKNEAFFLPVEISFFLYLTNHDKHVKTTQVHSIGSFFLSLFLCLPFFLSVCLSFVLSFSFCLSICLSIYTSIYLSIYISIYLLIYLSIYLFIYINTYISNLRAIKIY